MDSTSIQVLIFGILAATANVLGGLSLFPSRLHSTHKRYLKYLLALGAGFMLAVTLLEMLPKSIQLWQQESTADHPESSYFVPMMLVMGGYLLTQFFEHTIAPHFHLGEEMHCDEHDHEMISGSAAYTAVAGLLIHTFFDGVSIAAAASVNSEFGLLVFIAIFLHKFPEGFTIGSMILAAGKGRREVIISTSLIGMTTLAGVVLFYFVGASMGFTVAYALPLAAGVTLYVAASDLIPEINHHGDRSPLISISVFAGVALFFATQQLLHLVAE